MYRLVLYYLSAALFAAFVFSFFHLLPFTPEALALSAIIILIVCWAVNWVFAYVFEVERNVESVYITALILALIISPVTATDYTGVGFLVFA